MRTTAVLATAATVLSLAAARSLPRQSKYENVVYWGQEDDGKERSLGDYCAAGEGVDIVIISFLSNFGNGVYPNGYLGDCSVNSDGSFDGCDSLASDVATCQAAGKKVFISIGGAGADWQLTSTQDAQGVAYSLWNSYAASAVVASGSPRPFGNSVQIDGFDIDIEDNGANNNSDQYLQDLVNELRNYFSNDTANTYYISGAPQCPLPIADMDATIKNSQYDYLWIQFYNNDCAAAELVKPGQSNPYGDGTYNLADWPAYLAGGASANAKLYVGIPSSTTGADYPYYYIDPSDLPTLIANSTGVAGFSGVMLYDAGDSDTTNSNGCNYAQEVRSVLDTGNPC